jgi:hypothetical protein
MFRFHKKTTVDSGGEKHLEQAPRADRIQYQFRGKKAELWASASIYGMVPNAGFVNSS